MGARVAAAVTFALGRAGTSFSRCRRAPLGVGGDGDQFGVAALLAT